MSQAFQTTTMVVMAISMNGIIRLLSTTAPMR